MPKTRSWLWDLTLLTLLCGVLFGAFLGTRPLAVPDEARYAEIPREMIVSGDYITPRVNAIKYFEKPPLFYWLQASAIKLFGLNEWSVRLITALMGLFGCLITYCAGRQLYGRLTGLLASLILATSVLYFFMARFITLDMALTVMLTGCLFSFIVGTRKPPGKERNLYMWSMYVFSALATLTKGLIGIVFPGAIIFIWMLLFNDWRNLKTYCLPTGIIIWLILVLPWHILAQHSNPEFFHFYIIDQHFARYLTEYANRSQPLWYLPLFLITGFFPWIAFLPQALKFHWSQSWPLRQDKTAIFLMIWAGFIYLFFSFSHSQLPPYVLPIFPPLAVLVGNYFAAHWQKRHHKSICLGLLVLAGIAISALIIGLYQILFSHWIPTEVIKYLVILAILAMLTGLLPLYTYWRYGVSKAIPTLLVTFAVFLVFTTPVYATFEEKSIKPLISKIKPLLKPNSQIVSYHGYYQDLPYYLQRRIIIVGWGNSELDFGMQHQNMKGWFLDDATFWQRWQSPVQMFMFLSQKDYNTLLKNNPNKKLCLIGATKRNVLVTNHC